jgi:hypothetical protein
MPQEENEFQSPPTPYRGSSVLQREIRAPGNRSIAYIHPENREATEEEQRQIILQVFGDGIFRKELLGTAGGAVGSIATTDRVKRQFAKQAGKGLATMGLKAAATKVPWIALGAGLGGAAGETARQLQVPDRVGDFHLTAITEPASETLDLLGLDPGVTYHPGSILSKAKRVAVRAGEEAGLDLGFGAATKLAGLAGRGLFRLGMGSPGGPMPGILSQTRNVRSDRGALGVQAPRGATGLEDVMRLGEEGRIGSTGIGRVTPGRIPPDEGETVTQAATTAGALGSYLGKKVTPEWLSRRLTNPPQVQMFPGRQGKYPVQPLGTRATESGWGSFPDLARGMQESAKAAVDIVRPVGDTVVRNMDAKNIGIEIMNAGGPKGMTLGEWLKLHETSGLFTPLKEAADTAKKAIKAGLLDEKMDAVLRRYGVIGKGGVATTEGMVKPTIARVMDDVRFLQGHLDILYKQYAQGGGLANAQILVAKALEEALNKRVHNTLGEIAPEILKALKEQQSVSRVMGHALDLAKGSSDTMLTGMMLGATALGGGAGASAAGAVAAVPAAAAAAIPAALLGGVPPLSVKAGQALFNRRLSTVPQQALRGVEATMSDDPVPVRRRQLQPFPDR